MRFQFFSIVVPAVPAVPDPAVCVVPAVPEVPDPAVHAVPDPAVRAVPAVPAVPAVLCSSGSLCGSGTAKTA